MSEAIIESVSLEYPNSEESDSLWYEVGRNSVTEIKRCQKKGEHCFVDYFEIYSENKLTAELHHYSVVKYKKRK